jgi:hypothetical protein
MFTGIQGSDPSKDIPGLLTLKSSKKFKVTHIIACPRELCRKTQNLSEKFSVQFCSVYEILFGHGASCKDEQEFKFIQKAGMAKSNNNKH